MPIPFVFTIVFMDELLWSTLLFPSAESTHNNAQIIAKRPFHFIPGKLYDIPLETKRPFKNAQMKLSPQQIAKYNPRKK